MRWVSLFFAIVFLLFAVVQWNDPDPLIWIAAYGFAAAVSIPPIFGRYTPYPAIGVVVYLVWFFLLVPTIDANWIENEEARESFGLLICALWTGVLFYLWVRRRATAGEGA